MNIYDDMKAAGVPKWPPPGDISRKAYRCGTCLEVFHTETNHWGDIYCCKNRKCGSTSRSVCIEPAPAGYTRPVVSTIKTRIHYYRFNMRFRKEGLRFSALQADLENMGLTCSIALRNKAEILQENVEEDITLETTWLSRDQWNSTTSRVFDWYLGTDPETPDIRAGHWLEITEEMKHLRHNTIACGYCGHQQRAASRTHFHLGCLGQTSLKETELSSLRWRRIDDITDREPLTDEERAWLVPLYRSRQIYGAAGQEWRGSIVRRFEKEVRHATTERDGMLWLLDHAIKLDNVIYYAHTGRFGFGWQTPLSASEKEELQARLAEFPFPYDIK